MKIQYTKQYAYVCTWGLIERRVHEEGVHACVTTWLPPEPQVRALLAPENPNIIRCQMSTDNYFASDCCNFLTVFLGRPRGRGTGDCTGISKST